MPEPLTIAVGTAMYLSALATHRGRGSLLHGDTAVSIQHSIYFPTPTEITTVVAELASPTNAPLAAAAADSVGWIDLAQTVFAESRSMTAEERAALDDFTWAELRS
jgi:hypothetical protein